MMINLCVDFREQNYCNLQDSFEISGKFAASKEVLLRYFAWRKMYDLQYAPTPKWTPFHYNNER